MNLACSAASLSKILEAAPGKCKVLDDHHVSLAFVQTGYCTTKSGFSSSWDQEILSLQCGYGFYLDTLPKLRFLFKVGRVSTEGPMASPWHRQDKVSVDHMKTVLDEELKAIWQQSVGIIPLICW